MISAPSQKQDAPTSRAILATIGSYSLLLLPVLVHLLMVYRYSVNIPYVDDYTFLADCLHWHAGGLTFVDKLKHLFHPHGEHIILFARLTVLADVWLEGSLNFRTLFFAGNATLLGTVWLLYRVSRRSAVKPWQFIPIVFLLFQPQYYENTLTWAICALQHLPALFFAIWAFDLISRPTKWAFWLGLPIAFLGVFSNGNGLAVLVVGLLLLLIQRQRTRLFLWIGFSVVCFSLYAYVHHLYHSPDMGSNLMHPIRVLAGFFLMAGSMSLLVTRSIVGISIIGVCLTALISLVAGTGLFAYAGFTVNLIPNHFRIWLNRWSPLSVSKSFVILATSYLYVLITLAGISFGRSMGWYQGLLLPRFVWFATVAFALGYLLILLWARPDYRRRISFSTLLFSICFNLLAYWVNFGEVMTIRQSLQSDLHNWRESGLLVTMPANSREHDQFYSDMLRAAVDKQLYKLPPSILEPAIRQSATVAVSEVISRDSSFVLGEGSIRSLSIGAGLPPVGAFDTQEYFLLLTSKDHTFVWAIDRSPTKLPQYLITGKSTWPNNLVWVFADQLPPARYRPSVAFLANGQWTVVSGNSLLTIGSKANQ